MYTYLSILKDRSHPSNWACSLDSESCSSTMPKARSSTTASREVLRQFVLHCKMKCFLPWTVTLVVSEAEEFVTRKAVEMTLGYGVNEICPFLIEISGVASYEIMTKACTPERVYTVL